MTEGPYKLPDGWRWVRLGEIVLNIQPGFAFGKKKTVNGDLLHVRPFNIGIDGELDLAQKVYISSTGVEEGLVQLEPGDVLFNNTNSVELVGKTALVRESLKAAWSNHVTRLRTDTSKCEPGWLAFSLRVLWLQGFFARNCNKWIGQAGFNTDALKATEIPLPPLSEQRRIVARIEELMERIREARRLREEARQDTERLWQAVLAETFPRPGSELPEGWRWVRLGEVCEIWDHLRRPVKKKLRNPGEIPYCGANGVIDYVSGYTHEGEFVLLAEDGGFYGPGEQSAYLMRGRFWANNHVHIVRGKPEILTNTFLLYWLIVADLRPYLTGATRPKLTQNAMRNILIPLPPLSEQRRIVAHLEAVQARIQVLKEEQAATQAELKRLEQAILEKAFRGEL